jgi:hypothetical protein
MIPALFICSDEFFVRDEADKIRRLNEYLLPTTGQFSHAISAIVQMAEASEVARQHTSRETSVRH